MALKGIRVVELSGLAPAPFCGMLLADFGATVTRVDKVGSNSLEDFMGHGKRSIAVNLKHPEGIKVIKRMCRESDVLIEPFRKGVMEKLGLGPSLLIKENPRLIYARLTGFGQSGPYSSMAGHDINYVAVSGVLSMLGRHGENPTPPINLLADFAGGGLMCAFGILLALLNRSRIEAGGGVGKGQVIDASMVEGSAYVASWLYRSRKRLPIWGNERGKNVLDSGSHFYDTYETKDGGHVAVGALEPQFYKRLLEGLGLSRDIVPQFGADDPEGCREILKQTFLKKTRDEWAKIFDGTDACVTPVLLPEEVGSHCHNAERGSFFKLSEDAELNEWIPKPSPCLSETPGVSQASLHPKPTVCGEHTTIVLQELGYSNEEIKKLEDAGVVDVFQTNRSKL
ncbi:alpha-methylacyl-CoA racemase [Ischnura elegans]|uniref:alpha-methylacyl-CoA racemase n=1 Tax=Ischnura elegans TaxID=197161 RepID=UPI001ED8A6EB|nr:alpha-methylacyl-CoA racemase [Ischnura elegans]